MTEFNEIWKKNTSEADQKFLLWINQEGNLEEFRKTINEKHMKTLDELKGKLAKSQQEEMKNGK